jgi:phage gp36-like protein
MRYIDWADVTGRYLDAAKITDSSDAQRNWINGAEAEVDARLASRYVVPFANTPTLCPDMIRDLTVDLTYFKMSVGRIDTDPLKKYLDERFKGLLDGTLTITTSAGEVEDSSLLAWSDRDGYGTSFGIDDPVNWNVSSQWLEAQR